MKRIRLLLLLIILLLATTSVKAMQIKSIELKEKSNTVVINNEPVINGLAVDIDAKFDITDDFIKYNIVLFNDSEEEYQVGKDLIKTKEEDYFTYSYEIDKEIIKPGDTVNLLVTITYEKEPEEAFTNEDSIVTTNNISFDLKEVIEEAVPVEEANPQTYDKQFIYLIILSISIIGVAGTIYLIKKTGRKQYLLIVIGLLILNIPGIRAIQELRITINTKLEITDPKQFCMVELIEEQVIDGDAIEFEGRLRSDPNADENDNELKIGEIKYYSYTAEDIDMIHYKDNNFENICYTKTPISGGYSIKPVNNIETIPECRDYTKYFNRLERYFIYRENMTDEKINYANLVPLSTQDPDNPNRWTSNDFGSIQNKKIGCYVVINRVLIYPDAPRYDAV